MNKVMRSNAILLTIDSLRYEHMSLYGYNKDTTPALKELCGTNTCVHTVVRVKASYTKALFRSKNQVNLVAKFQSLTSWVYEVLMLGD